VWAWALAGAALLMGVKAVLVASIVRWAGVDPLTAWRTGLLLAVGGEFGFALLALGLQGGIVGERLGQAVLGAVLVSMIAGPLLIHFNHALALRLAPRTATGTDLNPLPASGSAAPLSGHVMLAGFGRVGQSLGHFLEAEAFPWLALDLDASRVREARLAVQPVHYGDTTQIELLESLGLASARLVIITHGDSAAALKTLRQIRSRHPTMPVMVRARDPQAAAALRAAGATEVFPETLEAGLTIAAQALLLLEVPPARVAERVQAQRASHYRQLRQLFGGDTANLPPDVGYETDRLHAVRLPAGSLRHGQALAAIELQGVVVTAFVRDGTRRLQPGPESVVEAGDTLVLFGPPAALSQAETRLLA